MAKRYLITISFFLFIVMMTGCPSTETVESRKVASTEIYQNYSITARKDKTSVSATFRVGGATGTTVDLDAPSKIIHNGKEMNESKPGFMKGTDYNDSADEFTPTHKFIYTDAKGKSWQNEIMVQPLEITSDGINISKKKGGKIILSRAIGKDENIECTITSDQTPPDETTKKKKVKTPVKQYSVNLPLKFDKPRSAIVIAPLTLKNFADGSANIHLILRKTKDITQSAKGGLINFSYESGQVSANVIN